MIKQALLLLLFFLCMTGCAPSGQSNGQTADYEGTKKLVIDILKTDEGKEAIEDVLTDENIQSKLIMDEATVKKAIQDSLTSEEAEDFWKSQFENPSFVESYAKALKDEHEKLIKDLMKDPDYQAAMIDILKNPEIEEQLTDIMKNQQYREQMKTVILETMESPLFKVKMQDLLIKGAEELQKKDEESENADSEEDSANGESE